MNRLFPLCSLFRLLSSSKATSAATIHKVHSRQCWRKASWRERPALVAAALFWPFVAARKAFKLTRRLGGAVRATSGKSRVRQYHEQLRLALTHGIPPSSYYMFELWRPERFRRASQYLLRYEIKGSIYGFCKQLCLDHGATIGPLNNKAKFYKHCVEAGLRTVPILFSMKGGKVTRLAATTDGLPHVDLFVKPNKGKGGRAAQRWDYIGDGRFRSVSGKVLSASSLRKRLVKRSRAEKLIVEPRLVNHPSLADLSNGALNTVRIVTCLDEQGGPEITSAVIRMSKGKNVTIDNFHAGGIAAEVDIAMGSLGPASDQGLEPTSTWLERHPQTGATIAGRQLPGWPAAVALVVAAHAAFGGRVLIGWDVALLAEGPCLIEGNGSPDLDIMQRICRRPLGNERLGILLAHHAVSTAEPRDLALDGRGSSPRPPRGPSRERDPAIESQSVPAPTDRASTALGDHPQNGRAVPGPLETSQPVARQPDRLGSS